MDNRNLLERSLISAKLSAMLRELHPSVGNTFKDSYVLEFLGLSYLSMRLFWIGICRKEVHHDCA